MFIFLCLSVLAAITAGVRIVDPQNPILYYNYTCETFETLLFTSTTQRLAEIPASSMFMYWGELVFHDLFAPGATPSLDGSFLYGNRTRRTHSKGRIEMTASGSLAECCIQDPSGTAKLQLFALYVLFAEEHNYQAERIHRGDSRKSDQTLFTEARNLIVALIQKITMHEWLPIALGNRQIAPFRTVHTGGPDPEVVVEFQAAMPAVFATMSSDRILYSDQNKELTEIPLNFGFNMPDQIHRILGGVEGTCTIITGVMRDPLRRVQSYLAPSLVGIHTMLAECTKERTFNTSSFQTLVPVIRALVPDAYSSAIPPAIINLSDITTSEEKQAIIRSLFPNGTSEAAIVSQLDIITALIMEDVESTMENDVLGPVSRALVYLQMVNFTRDRDIHWYETDDNRKERTGLNKKHQKRVRESGLADIVLRTCKFVDDDGNMEAGKEFTLWAVSDVDVMVVEQSNLDTQNTIIIVFLMVFIGVFLAAVVVAFFVLKRK